MRSLLSLPIVSCTRHCLSSRVRRLATFFVKSQELRRVISANETELDRLRKEYSAGKNLSATAGRIQELEKLLMTLYPQPEDYEKQSREAELSFLQKK